MRTFHPHFGGSLTPLSMGIENGRVLGTECGRVGPLPICGLQFFEGLIDEHAQPEADVEVPLGAKELEPLTGLGRDADVKWYTVQQQDTHQHIKQQIGYKATLGNTHLP